MKKSRVATLVATTVLVLGLSAFGLQHHQQLQSARTAKGSGAAPANAGTLAANPPLDNADRRALLNRPQVRGYQARLDFQNNAQRFFAEAGKLDQASRRRQAQALEADIDRYQNAGELSAGETVMLRIGLIRATESDQAAQIEQISDLVARYQVHAERRNAAFLQSQRNDPAFNDYKARESRVVAEVMAMKSIPDGLSRNEYLRQRLQHEREIAYGNGPP